MIAPGAIDEAAVELDMQRQVRTCRVTLGGSILEPVVDIEADAAASGEDDKP